MALKDWRKVGKDTWLSKKCRIIKVAPIDSSVDSIYFSKNDKYMVVITSTDWPLSVLNRFGFKTKSQALKFAKRYMRGH